MKIKLSQEKCNSLKAIGSIAVGTATGLASYIFFLYFTIAIFGWNLGLIFAPLIAGSVETELANEYIGESIGAVSAFILFIVTVVYGFIINNPTLGANVITVGSLIVIAQAAVPILINYILILVFGIIFYYLGIFKKITDFIYYKLKEEYYHKILKKPLPVVVKKSYFYNDIKRCHQLNSSDFVFLTTLEPFDRKIEEYMDDADSILAKFNETDECPEYIVSYRSSSGFGAVRYKFFYEEEEKNAFVDDYDKCLGPVCWTKSYWAGLTSSSGSNDDPEDNVIEGEEVFKKTFTSSSSGNPYGEATFSFKYNEQNGNYRQSVVDFSDSEVSPILIDKSIDHFRTTILEPSRDNKFPESLYCGTITSYLTLTRDYVVIVGGEVQNGSVVCGFDKTLFNDATNKLIRFRNPDYSHNGENDEDEDDDDSSGGSDEPQYEDPDYKVDGDTTVADICNMPEYRKPMKIVGIVINFAKIIVPIIIIGFGVMDLYKAITSSKDDGIKKAVKSIVIRVIAGVAIFLLPGLIQFVLNWVNEWSDYENSWCCCTDCLLNPDCDTSACNSDSCRIEGMN